MTKTVIVPVKANLSLLGATLRALRRTKGLTLASVAASLGFSSHTAYQKYESGAVFPPPDKLAALAELFGVTTDYLLGRPPKLELPAVVEQFMLKGAQGDAINAFTRALARAGSDHAKLGRIKTTLDHLFHE